MKSAIGESILVWDFNFARDNLYTTDTKAKDVGKILYSDKQFWRRLRKIYPEVDSSLKCEKLFDVYKYYLYCINKEGTGSTSRICNLGKRRA